MLAGFDWDDGNFIKCQKHGVTPEEIEGLFQHQVAVFPDPGHSGAEERFIAIGRTAVGRRILLVFTLRRRGVGTFVRPVSARFMHKKEIEHYEKAIASIEQ